MTDSAVASEIEEFRRKKSEENSAKLFLQPENSQSSQSNHETIQRMLVKQKLKQNRELYRPVRSLKQSQV